MDAINEGLITRALYINENVGNNVELKMNMNIYWI